MSKRVFFAYINATTWLTYQFLFNKAVYSLVAIASSVSLVLSTPSLISLCGKLAYIYQHELSLNNILSSLGLLLPWHFVLIVSFHLLIFELALTNTLLFLFPSVRDSVNSRFGPEFLRNRGYNSPGKTLVASAINSGKMLLAASGVAVGGVAIAGTVDVVTDYQYHTTVRQALERGPVGATIKAIERPNPCLASFGSFASQALTKN